MQLEEIKNKFPRVIDYVLQRLGYGVRVAAMKDRKIMWSGGHNFIGSIEFMALPYDIDKDAWPPMYPMITSLEQLKEFNKNKKITVNRCLQRFYRLEV